MMLETQFYIINKQTIWCFSRFLSQHPWKTTCFNAVGEMLYYNLLITICHGDKIFEKEYVTFHKWIQRDLLSEEKCFLIDNVLLYNKRSQQ